MNQLQAMFILLEVNLLAKKPRLKLVVVGYQVSV